VDHRDHADRDGVHAGLVSRAALATDRRLIVSEEWFRVAAGHAAHRSERGAITEAMSQGLIGEIAAAIWGGYASHHHVTIMRIAPDQPVTAMPFSVVRWVGNMIDVYKHDPFADNVHCRGERIRRYEILYTGNNVPVLGRRHNDKRGRS